MNRSASVMALLASLLFLPMPARASQASPSSRLSQAKELLGKYYRRSVVASGEKVEDVDQFIGNWTKRALKGKWNSKSAEVSRTIIKESKRYGFDPIFLMAVIENESSFNPAAKGGDGEIGLMQIRPATAKWIARKYKVQWAGKKTLSDPSANIRIGTAYLAFLRDEFDSRGRFYLAAYNMGAKNVVRALEHDVWPKDYPNRVMQRYIRFYSELKNDLTAKKVSETD